MIIYEFPKDDNVLKLQYMGNVVLSRSEFYLKDGTNLEGPFVFAIDGSNNVIFALKHNSIPAWIDIQRSWNIVTDWETTFFEIFKNNKIYGNGTVTHTTVSGTSYIFYINYLVDECSNVKFYITSKLLDLTYNPTKLPELTGNIFDKNDFLYEA